MTQALYDKAVHRCFFVFDSIPVWYKTQEISDKLVFEDPSLKFVSATFC